MSRQHFGQANVPLSPTVRAGDFIFVSDQVPTLDGALVSGGVGAQTRQVLDNVAAVLALAGAALSDVVKTTVILADARDFTTFNTDYASYFPIRRPARRRRRS